MTNHYWDRVTAPHADRDRTEPPTARVERWCEVMHDAYERAAVGAGWETNPASRKPWAEVPEANKATMRAAVGAVAAAADQEQSALREAIARVEAVCADPDWANGHVSVVRVLHALRSLQPTDRPHCEGHGGPGRWYCCQHPDAGWPCTETAEDES